MADGTLGLWQAGKEMGPYDYPPYVSNRCAGIDLLIDRSLE